MRSYQGLLHPGGHRDVAVGLIRSDTRRSDIHFENTLSISLDSNSAKASFPYNFSLATFKTHIP